MPVYEFRCDDCKSKFEVFTPQRMNTDGTICRHCHSTKVNRLISTFAALGGDGDLSYASAEAPQATGGGCCGGSCGCGH